MTLAILPELKRQLVHPCHNVTLYFTILKEEDTGDPAANDLELDSKLRELGRVAEQKLNKVFEEFACKQANGANDDDDDTEEDVCDDSDDQDDHIKDENDDSGSLKSEVDDDPIENFDVIEEDDNANDTESSNSDVDAIDEDDNVIDPSDCESNERKDYGKDDIAASVVQDLDALLEESDQE